MALPTAEEVLALVLHIRKYLEVKVTPLARRADRPLVLYPLDQEREGKLWMPEVSRDAEGEAPVNLNYSASTSYVTIEGEGRSRDWPSGDQA